jgi:hypothetical protein
VESLPGYKTAKQKRRFFGESPSLMRPIVYERMKAGAFVQISDSGAGKRLFRRFQMEQALYRNRHLFLFRLFR